MTSIELKSAQSLVHVYDRVFESVVFGTGKVLYGINIDCRPEACRVILKAHTKGKPEIAFLNASTLDRCFELVDALCNSRADIGVKWHVDEYYKPTADDSKTVVDK